VRVLLDECLPRRLKRELVGHDARTVPEMGWASNGIMVKSMWAGFTNAENKAKSDRSGAGMREATSEGSQRAKRHSDTEKWQEPSWSADVRN
jgi:hypothetical protein